MDSRNIMVYDKGGNRFSEGLADDDVTKSEFGSRIDFAGVIFNPSYTGEEGNGKSPKLNLIKTIVHEIGHCVNLGHPSGAEANYAPAVMSQGHNKNLAYWDNYPAPTYLDLNALRQIYTKIYS